MITGSESIGVGRDSVSAGRELWPGGPVTSALGLGTWAIGGPSSTGSQPLGWGSDWDRAEAADVVQAAFEAGITLFDTADAYGAGTAERLLGEVLHGHREEVVLVSKWGNTIDEASRQLTGQNPSAGYVRRALEASLRRLRTDYLDLYLLHLSGLPVAEADGLLPVLEDLVREGKIRGYGWSTDDPDLAAAWVGRPGVRVIEFEANVLHDAPELIQLCETRDVTALARGPLGTGLITGAYPAGSRIVDELDFRYRSPEWLNYFTDGRPDPVLTARLEALIDILTSDGRTIAQGALAWHWARSTALVPIPGATSVAQVRENAAAWPTGPLTTEQMDQIQEALATTPET